MNIGNYLQKYKLEDFKVVYGETLFEPYWENLRVCKCPLCGNRLKSPRHTKVLICSGKKHSKPFIIKEDTYNRLGGMYTRDMLYRNSLTTRNR